MLTSLDLKMGDNTTQAAALTRLKKGFLVFGGTMCDPSWGLPIIVAGKDCKTVKCVFFCVFKGLYNLNMIYLLFSLLQFLCLVNHKWNREPKNKLYRIRSLHGYESIIIVLLPGLFICSFWNESGLSECIIQYLRSDVMLTQTKEQILWHISKTEQEILLVFTNINNS